MHQETEPSGPARAPHITATAMLPMFLLFVVAGAPLVYLIWHFINDLLLGRFDPVGAGLAVLGAAGLFGVLVLVKRQISRWEET